MSWIGNSYLVVICVFWIQLFTLRNWIRIRFPIMMRIRIATLAVTMYMQCCGSGIRCLFDPWNRDGKKSGSGFGMNNQDQISESLETIFWVKILDADPGSGMEKFGYGIRDGKNSDTASRINIPDPQHCICCRQAEASCQAWWAFTPPSPSTRPSAACSRA